MTAFSDYFRTKILEWFQASAFPSAPSTVYLRLYNGDPTRDGTGGTDVTATVTGSTAISVASTVWSAITADGEAKYISNGSSISIGTALAVETITHIGVWDAATGGEYLGGASSGSFVTGIGTPIVIDAGALLFRLP